MRNPALSISRFGILATLVLCVIGAGVYAVGEPELPILPYDKEKAVSRPGCEVFCSQFKLRTGNARISWETPKALEAHKRLDFTVHKNGFKTGAFASFPTLREKQEMTPATMAQPEMRGVRAFQLGLTEVKLAKQRGARASVVVEGLEPGLNYRWRVLTRTNDGWVPSETLVCAAPVCPADMIQEKK